MSRFAPADVKPIFAPTQAQVDANKAAEESKSFSNSIGNIGKADVWISAYRSMDPIINAGRYLEHTFVGSYDPNYKLTGDKLSEYTKDVDPAFWGMFHGVQSEFDAYMIRQRALEKTRDRTEIANGGWGAVGATMAVSIFNPTAIAVGLATGGSSMTVPTVNAVRATRIARLLEAGAANALPQMALDTVVASENPDFNTSDVLSGGAGAFSLGATLNVASGLNTLKRAAAAGAGQAIPTLAVDSLLTDRSRTELAGAFAMNLVFGAGIGAAGGKSEAAKDFEAYGRKLHAEVDKKALHEEGLAPDYVPPVQDEESLRMLAGFDPTDLQPNVPQVGGIIDNKPQVRPSIVSEVANTPQSYFVPGRVAIGEVPAKSNFEIGDLDLSGASAARVSLEGVRFVDPLGNISRVGTDTERLMANMLSYDPFGKADGSPSLEGAADWADRASNGIVANFTAKHDNHFAQFIDEVADIAKNAGPGVEAFKFNRQDFNEIVWNQVVKSGKKSAGGIVVDGPEPLMFAAVGQRQVGAYPDVFANLPSVKAAVENYQKTIAKDTLDLLKRHEVRGAETIDHDPSFVSVVAEREKIDAFIHEKPENLDKLREVVAEGIMRKMRGAKVDPFTTLFPNLAVQEVEASRKKVAVLIADQWINNVGTHNEEMARATRSALSHSALEELVPKLQQATGLDEASVRGILFDSSNKTDKPNVPASFLKSRIDMDYTVSKRFADGSVVSIADFLNKDIEGLSQRYARKATGAAAAAEVGRVMKFKLGLEEAPATIDEMLATVQIAQKSRMGDGTTERELLGSLLKKTYGYPAEMPTTPSHKLMVSSLRSVRAVARFRTMTTFAAAINQATEYAGIIAKHGFGVFFDAIPAARQFIEEIKAGKTPEHGLMHLMLKDGIGLGSITERVNVLAPMDDSVLVASGKTWQERAAGKLDKGSMYLSRGQQKFSGDALVRNHQERVAYFSAAESLAQQAKGAKERITDAKMLSDMGVTKKQYDAIMSHLEKHARQTDLGIHEPNLSKWVGADGKADLASQAAYTQLLRRDAQDAVNRGSSTLLPKWTDGTIGKLFSQLSTYGIQSYTTRLLPILRDPGEARTYAKLLHYTTSSVMAYALWTYIASIGRPDQKEFLERRLNPKELVKAAFSRSSWTSLLPRFADAGMALAGEDAIFAPQRVSGVGAGDGSRFTNIAFGSPAIEQFQKMIDAGQGVTLPWLRDDYDFSQRDVRNIVDGFGIPNWMNARNLIMRAAEDLPERPN